MADYINNKEFYALLVDYKRMCNEAEEAGEDRPRVPDEIGKCFYMIATKLATNWRFSGYTYKEEMVGDGIENCIVAVHNFNAEKSQNPFGYFTQIVWYAFLRRIEKEKRQTFVKYKSLEHFIIESGLNNENGNAYSNFDITNEKMKPILEKYEQKPKKKRQAKKVGIERFVGEE
jgi:hypothetical protein